MRNLVCLSFLLLPGQLLDQGTPEESIETLIKKLGSANFRDRDTADKALRERAQAELALRTAMRSADLETQRRMQEILAYYEGRPLRELKNLAKEGRINEFIHRVATGPAGKGDEELLLIVRTLTHSIKDLHVKKGGYKLQLLTDKRDHWQVLRAERFTSSTKVKEGVGYLLLASEVDLDRSGLQPADEPNFFHLGCAVVASGKVRVQTFYNGTHVIFAGSSVEIIGHEAENMLIVSGGDVVLKCILAGSIVIARGKVTINEEQIANRIIAGKSVVKELGLGGIEPRDCFITENEPNPLGFIRWSEPSKQKVMPEPK